MATSIRTTLRSAAFLASIAFGASAAAQTPPPPPPAPAGAPDPKIEEAREAFRIGSALAKQAQWVDALAAFERSAKLRPHAVTTYNIGFCERALGRFTRAKRSLSRALSAPANELPADLAAEARGYLADVEQRIARAVITLGRSGVSVAVDGRPLEPAGGTPAHPELVAGTREPGAAEPVAAMTFDLLLDAGTHVIVVSAPGAADAVVTRSFAAGSTTSLELAPVPIKASAPEKRASTGSSGRRTAGAVALGLGGAFAVLGGVFGGLSIKKRSDLDGVCMPKDQCPANAQSTISAMNGFANASTVGFVGAAAGVTLGVVLLATSREPAPSAPTASPVIGPGYVGVRGSF